MVYVEHGIREATCTAPDVQIQRTVSEAGSLKKELSEKERPELAASHSAKPSDDLGEWAFGAQLPQDSEEKTPKAEAGSLNDESAAKDSKEVTGAHHSSIRVLPSAE
jgi:hypothetical protein